MLFAKAVSKARPVHPNATLFSTRRVHKRQLLLRPSDTVNQVVAYVVAVLAERYDLLLHALTVLGNHTHDVTTDPLGLIVKFHQDAHALITRCLNARYGDFESMWSTEPTNRVTCQEPGDMVDKIAYTLANPVSSYLVTKGSHWPGLRAAWPAKPQVVKRPWWFFRDADEGGKWPEEVTLRFHRPPGFEHLSDDELAAHIAEVTAGKEEKARQKAAEKGIRFLGRRAVRRQSRYAYPSSTEKRFTIRPQVAAKSKWARIEALQRNRDWLKDYEAALVRYRAGDDSAVFPFGTYQMRWLFGVHCRPPPA